jgi:adenylate kinase
VAEIDIRECRKILERGRNVVLDGSPRTLYEAERDLAALRAGGASRVLVIVLDVPKPETVRRVLRRWICAECRQPAPVVKKEVPKRCGACGGLLIRRPDDTADIMDRRWEEYTFRTLPVIELFERQGLVARIDGRRPIPEVWAAVRDVLQRSFGLTPR